jgi:hypothetical protein
MLTLVWRPREANGPVCHGPFHPVIAAGMSTAFWVLASALRRLQRVRRLEHQRESINPSKSLGDPPESFGMRLAYDAVNVQVRVAAPWIP